MIELDRATEFSLEYLQILEERLCIHWNENCDPVCLLDEVNIFTMERIKYEMADIFDGSSLENAIIDSRNFGQNEVQSVGFGLASNFDKFIKVGFLCGKRLVLWDFIYGRILQDIYQPGTAQVLAQVACNLLLLKEIVKLGGVVILPHPTSWSEKANYQLNLLNKVTGLNPQNIGLTATLSVLDEIPLHPYTLFDGESQSWPEHPEGLANHTYFSKEEAIIQRAISDFFEHTKFAYLDRVRPVDFYHIMCETNELYSQVKHLLDLPKGVVSPQQLKASIKQKAENLSSAIKKRNKEVVKSKAPLYGSSISFLVSSGALLHSSMSPSSSGTTLCLGMATVAASLISYVGNVLNKNKTSILVQAFRDLKKVSLDNPSN